MSIRYANLIQTCSLRLSFSPAWKNFPSPCYTDLNRIQCALLVWFVQMGGDKLKARPDSLFTRLLYLGAWRFGISTGTNRLSLSIFLQVFFSFQSNFLISHCRGPSPLCVLYTMSFVIRQTFQPSKFQISIRRANKPLSPTGTSNLNHFCGWPGWIKSQHSRPTSGWKAKIELRVSDLLIMKKTMQAAILEKISLY